MLEKMGLQLHLKARSHDDSAPYTCMLPRRQPAIFIWFSWTAAILTRRVRVCWLRMYRSHAAGSTCSSGHFVMHLFVMHVAWLRRLHVFEVHHVQLLRVAGLCLQARERWIHTSEAGMLQSLLHNAGYSAMSILYLHAHAHACQNDTLLLPHSSMHGQ